MPTPFPSPSSSSTGVHLLNSKSPPKTCNQGSNGHQLIPRLPLKVSPQPPFLRLSSEPKQPHLGLSRYFFNTKPCFTCFFLVSLSPALINVPSKLQKNIYIYTPHIPLCSSLDNDSRRGSLFLQHSTPRASVKLSRVNKPLLLFLGISFIDSKALDTCIPLK